ncbi:6-bladed beta-propeller [Patescibacteria group bacterium]
MDNVGNVYVADDGRPTFYKFDSNGQYIKNWGLTSVTEVGFGDPWGIVFSPVDEFLYAVDYNHLSYDSAYTRKVIKYTTNGQWVGRFGSVGIGDGQFSGSNAGVRGISVDSLGYVYVADTGNSRIQKFKCSGLSPTPTPPAWSCGDPLIVSHAGAGEAAPVDKTVTYGTVLSDLSGSNKCWITQNLGATRQATSPTDASEEASGWYFQFNRKQGYQYTTTRTPSTSWISSIDESSNWDSTNDPCTLELGSDWRVPTYTEWRNADTNGDWDNYTEAYNSELGLHAGGFLWYSNGSLTSRGTTGYITSATQQSSTQSYRLYLMSSGAGTNSAMKSNAYPIRCVNDILVPTPTSTPTPTLAPTTTPTATPSPTLTPTPVPPACTFNSKWGESGSDNGQFDSPGGVAVDSNNNVYVSDRGNSRIQKFDSNGNFILTWGSFGTGDGQFYLPMGIVVDNDGNILIADSNNHRIQKFDTDGTFISKFGGPYGEEDGQFKYPQGVAVDSLGNIYVADSSNNRVQKFSSDGIFLSKFGSYGTGDGQFNAPTDVVIDLQGYIYVSDLFNNRIQKFDADGNFIFSWGTYGSGDGEFKYPRGLAFDSQENIFVVDINNYRIQKFSSDGIFLSKFGSYGTGDSQFVQPYYLDFSMSGSLYVTDYDNNRVQKFECEGSWPTPTITNIPTPVPTSTFTPTPTDIPTPTPTPSWKEPDIDGDGEVGTDDMDLILDSFGEINPENVNDLDSNGTVNALDAVYIMANWSTVTPTPTLEPTVTLMPTPSLMPTNIPTPIPTISYSCNVSLLPSTYSLRSRQSVGLTAYISVFGGASVNRVEFISSNSGLVNVLPTTDYSYPYQTTASTKNIKSTDSVTVKAKVYLNGTINTCFDTSTIVVSKN